MLATCICHFMNESRNSECFDSNQLMIRELVYYVHLNLNLLQIVS